MYGHAGALSGAQAPLAEVRASGPYCIMYNMIKH